MGKDRDYHYAWAHFCLRIKLKDYWEERTSYNWPFSCPMFRDQNKPYKSFMYEVWQVDDLDMCFESDWEQGGKWIKKRVSRQARYNFNKRYDYLWFKEKYR